MPQVPYVKESTAQPTSPGESISINTPGAAFGTNVASAIEHLGTTGEQVGNELFQRALALQDLKNENDARQAQSNYAIQAGQKQADFDALEGQDKVNALSGHLADISKLRQDLRGKLNTPVAQRMFDTDTLPFMQRNIIQSSTQAGAANKQFTLNTYANTATSYEQQAAQHPDDSNYVEGMRDKIRDAVANAAMIKYGVHDENDPNVALAVNNALSHQRAEQILAKGITDPITASQWEQKYGADLTNPVDKDRVSKELENRGAAVVASNVASQVVAAHRQPDGSFDLPATQLEQLAKDEATKVLPKNTLVADTVATKLKSLMYTENAFVKQEQQDAKIQFNQILADQNITDAQHFLAIPGADKIMEKLPPNMRTVPQIEKYIANFQSSANKQTNEYWATTINGMKSSDSAGFMSLDPTDPKYHLNKQDIIKVQNEQQAMAKNPQDDPRVSRAMGWLLGARGAELKDLQVDQKHSGSEDDFYHFRGALQEALQVYQEDHPGKQPTYEDVVDKIGPQIIKTQFAKPGMLWGTNNVPAFQEFNRPNFEDIPVPEREKMIANFTKSGVAPPTEREMVQIYARQQFNKFYKGAAKSE